MKWVWASACGKTADFPKATPQGPSPTRTKVNTQVTLLSVPPEEDTYLSWLLSLPLLASLSSSESPSWFRPPPTSLFGGAPLTQVTAPRTRWERAALMGLPFPQQRNQRLSSMAQAQGRKDNTPAPLTGAWGPSCPTAGAGHGADGCGHCPLSRVALGAFGGRGESGRNPHPWC